VSLLWPHFPQCMIGRIPYCVIAMIQSVQILNNFISQGTGNAATRIRCDGMFNDRFVAYFLSSVSVKYFLELVKM